MRDLGRIVTEDGGRKRKVRMGGEFGMWDTGRWRLKTSQV